MIGGSIIVLRYSHLDLENLTTEGPTMPTDVPTGLIRFNLIDALLLLCIILPYSWYILSNDRSKVSCMTCTIILYEPQTKLKHKWS